MALGSRDAIVVINELLAFNIALIHVARVIDRHLLVSSRHLLVAIVIAWLLLLLLYYWLTELAINSTHWLIIVRLSRLSHGSTSPIHVRVHLHYWSRIDRLTDDDYSGDIGVVVVETREHFSSVDDGELGDDHDEGDALEDHNEDGADEEGDACEVVGAAHGDNYDDVYHEEAADHSKGYVHALFAPL